ncbi:MAG: cytochrome c [Thermoguttaceae bacterium]
MSRRWRAVVSAMVLLSCAACRQQMADQPYYRPLEPSRFFDNRMSARGLVPGTVARGDRQAEPELATGIRGDAYEVERIRLPVARTDLDQKPYVKEFPFPVTEAVLARGRQRYNIYCIVCHGPLGYGDGIVVQRGFTRPPSYHTERLRKAPPGYFVDVIARGFGSMPDYATPVPPADRWAIAAYLRALQFSQHAPLEELPEEVKQRLLQGEDNRARR